MADSSQLPEGQALMEGQALAQADVESGGGVPARRWPAISASKATVAALTLGFCGIGAFAATHWAGRKEGPRDGAFSPEGVMGADLVPVLGPGFCGVKGNPHLCPELLGVLARTGVEGAGKMLCMDNMAEEECQLDTMFRGWETKDPTQCLARFRETPGLLYLWSTPDSINADPSGFSIDILCGGPTAPCPQWAAKAWIEYVDKWKAKMISARRAGLQVSTPRFSGDVLGKLRAFFQACPQCNQPGSPYYIDVLAFDDGINAGDYVNGFNHIKDVAHQMKAAYPGRPVVLSNLYIAASSPMGAANVVMNSGVFDRAGNPVDAVYWSVYPQGFSDPMARSLLKDVVEAGPQKGKTLGRVLMEKCAPQ